MSLLTKLAWFLLSLAGYSLGAVLHSGKKAPRRPRAADIVLLLVAGVALFAFGPRIPLSRWFLLPGGIAAGCALGLAASLAWGSTGAACGARETNPLAAAQAGKRRPWREFGYKVGTFQSRAIMGLFYFLIVTPFALGVKLFGDPLGLKPSRGGSHWADKKRPASDLESFRRQS